LRSTTLCLLLAAGSFAGRAALYGLLDANVGWGFGRYMRCVSPIYILILILGIMVATAWLRRWVSGGPPDPEGKPGGTTIRPG
jgi:hypothetical protein